MLQRALGGALRCSSRTVAACQRVPSVRGLCTKAPKPPRSFDSFFPQSAGRSRAETGKDGSKAESSGGGGGGGGGGGSGGGSGGPDSASALQQALFASAAVGGLMLLSMGGPGEARPTHEISMQHFLSNVLAQGRVRKLVVLNGTTVRVYLDSSPSAELSLDGSPAPSLSAPEASPVRTNGGGLPLDPTSEGSPVYYFTIGGPEQFEEKLEAAQASLRARLPPAHGSL